MTTSVGNDEREAFDRYMADGIRELRRLWSEPELLAHGVLENPRGGNTLLELGVFGAIGIVAWKSGVLHSLSSAVSGSVASLTSGGASNAIGTGPSSSTAGLALLAAVPDLPDPSAITGPTAQVPYVLGGSVAVPAAYVQLAQTARATLASSGYTPAGGYSSQTYVAGTQPATASSPAGGGIWAGLNDAQTASLFQATYGNNWQSVWQQQHAAAS
jgi:hypothetical protein